MCVIFLVEFCDNELFLCYMFVSKLATYLERNTLFLAGSLWNVFLSSQKALNILDRTIFPHNIWKDISLIRIIESKRNTTTHYSWYIISPLFLEHSWEMLLLHLFSKAQGLSNAVPRRLTSRIFPQLASLHPSRLVSNAPSSDRLSLPILSVVVPLPH